MLVADYKTVGLHGAAQIHFRNEKLFNLTNRYIKFMRFPDDLHEKKVFLNTENVPISDSLVWQWYNSFVKEANIGFSSEHFSIQNSGGPAQL